MNRRFKIILYRVAFAAVILSAAVYGRTGLNMWKDYKSQLSMKPQEEAFYKEHGIRQANPDEFSVKIYNLKDFAPPEHYPEWLNRFYWLDKDMIAYGPRSEQELRAGNPSPAFLSKALQLLSKEKGYVVFNLKTLEKKQVDALPKTWEGIVAPLTQQKIDSTRAKIIANDPLKANWQEYKQKHNPFIPNVIPFLSDFAITFSHPVVDGFVFLFGRSGGYTVNIGRGASFSIGTGLYLLTPDEFIQLIKGSISHIKASPDGCKVIFFWRKSKLYDDGTFSIKDHNSYLSLLDLCNNPSQ